MDWLNYGHLQYFWVVAREGSVVRASEVLHLTPATISIQIRDLEKSLGVKLFQKSGRGMALTEMGLAVQAYAQDIFTTGQELMDMVNGRPIGGPINLRVGIKDVMPKLVAYQLLEPTLRMPQPVRLTCSEGDITKLTAELAIHKLDVVLSEAPIDPSIKVKAYSHFLGESAVVLMGAKSLASRFRNGFPNSLAEAPFLLPTRNTILRRSLEHWFDELGVRPNIVGEFDDSAMLKLMGSKEIGVFPIPLVIRNEVEAMYGVEYIGPISGVTERFYALSVERKIKHPAVLLISEVAKRNLDRTATRR